MTGSVRQYITILHREDTQKASNYEKVRSSTVLIQEVKDEWIRANDTGIKVTTPSILRSVPWTE